MLTSVFGVNDEAYKDIDTLQRNQQKLIDATNYQTKFMISAIITLNNTEERIYKKLESFKEKFNQAIEYTNELHSLVIEVDHNRVNIYMLHMFQLANNFITETTNHYTGLWRIFIDKGSIYNILPQKQVTEIISAANNKLPSQLEIVQSQLLKTVLKENGTHLEVYGYFPIKDKEIYDLIYVTPIPKKHINNWFYSINMSQRVIGVNYNSEKFFKLDKLEFRDCLNNEDKFICAPVSIENMQTTEDCVINSLFKKN